MKEESNSQQFDKGNIIKFESQRRINQQDEAGRGLKTSSEENIRLF